MNNVKVTPIFLAVTGSRLYGNHRESSDWDYRGVGFTNSKSFLGILDKFEQTSDVDNIDMYNVPMDDRARMCMEDVEVYDFRKFIRLAWDANPNIIELLFTNSLIPSHYYWDLIMQNRDKFISKKALHTFSGYANAQLKRLVNHKSWIDKSPVYPERSEFDLTEERYFDKTALKSLRSMSNEQLQFLFKDEGIYDMLKKELAYFEAVSNFKKYTAHMNNRNKDRLNLEMRYGFDCYLDSETEFLTERGWLNFDDIENNDRVATINQRGKVEFQLPTNSIDKLYSGDLYTLETQDSKCTVTENHNMLISDCHMQKSNNFDRSYYDSYSNWHLVPMKEIQSGRRSNFHINCSARISENKDYPISDDMLRVIGCYVSDGTLNKKNSAGIYKCVRISQKQNGRLSEHIETVKSYNFTKYSYERQSKLSGISKTIIEDVWICHNSELVSFLHENCGYGSINKHLPDFITKLSKRQSELLLKVLISGDGTERKHSSIYYTTSKHLASDIQTLCIFAQKTCKIWGPYENNTSVGKCDMYQVYIKNEDKPVVHMNKNNHIKKNNVKDVRVVCFEVPNSTLVTRNSGKVSIQGNCKHASHLVRLFYECKRLMETGELVFPLPEIDIVNAVRSGDWVFEKVINFADEMDATLKEIHDKSDLPKEPDRKGLNELIQEISFDIARNERRIDVFA